MARFWLGTTDDDPTDTNNWAASSGGAGGASVPTSVEDVTFDDQGNNACTFVGSMNFGSLAVEAGYTAKLDLGDVAATLTITDGGDVTLDSGGEFDQGDAIISLNNGNFDNRHVTTYTQGTSEVVMAGTGNLISLTTNDLYKLTIAVGATITVIEAADVSNILAVNGSLTLAAGKALRFNSDLNFGAAGAITGSGTLVMDFPIGSDAVTLNGTSNMTGLAEFRILNPTATAPLGVGTYGATLTKVECTGSTRTFLLSAGEYVFSGNLEFQTSGGSLTIANDTYNPTITVQGDVIHDEQAGTITYNKGTGDMVLSGTGDQDIDFGNNASEDLEIDKTTSGDVTLTNCDLTLVNSELAGALTFASSTIVAQAGTTLTASGAGSPSWDLDGQTIKALVVSKSAGTLTFSAAWIADSYTQTLGTVDFNGQTLETTGDFTIIAGALIASGTDTMNGADITVGGDFSVAGVDGTLLNLRGTSAWTLDVTGRATATYVDTSYSNATAGNTVFAQGSTNSLNNSGWSFMVPRSIAIGIDDDAISLARRTEAILAG